LIGLETLIHAHCFRQQFGQNEEKTSEERKVMEQSEQPVVWI